MAEKVFTWRLGKLDTERTAPLTGGQIRAARAFIRWDQATLAERAAVPVGAIGEFEATDDAIGAENARAVAAVERAFAEVGVQFIYGANPGLRLVTSHDLDGQIQAARRRVEADVQTSDSMAEERASPRKGMAALRRGLSENSLRTLQAKRREKTPED